MLNGSLIYIPIIIIRFSVLPMWISPEINLWIKATSLNKRLEVNGLSTKLFGLRF